MAIQLYPLFKAFDSNGNLLSGGWGYAYEAGTDTPVTTYSNYGLTVANAWPVELNSKELYRILVPGGWFLSSTPSTDGRGAFQDPTHVSFWNENSFLYYTDRRKGRYIKEPVRFQAPRLYTTEKNEEQVCWVVAHLISLKDGYRPAGEIRI